MGSAQDQNAVIDLSPHELIIDNFAGGGGASLGIEQALGRHIDIAINHDAEALAMHTANHPHTRHFIESVWEVDPKKVCSGRPVGLAWFSPDCFPAGTLILTSEGYKPIELIKVDDLVLTHKRRWRKVTGTHTSTRPLFEIRGHGHQGLRVSPEHPFYVRRRGSNKAEWAPASMLGRGWYWATPTRIPALPTPKDVRSVDIDADALWSIGRELTARSIFSMEKPKWKWLCAHFGSSTTNLRIPGFLYGMKNTCRSAFLDGFIDGQKLHRHRGCKWGKAFVELQVYTRAGAFGLKTLANTLGRDAAVEQIEDTAGYATFKVRLGLKSDSKRVGFATDGLYWSPIKEQVYVENSATVYNLSVDGDESYVAEGVVVHNCKHHSKARGSKPVNKKIRGLAWVVIRWAKAVKPRVVALENVGEFSEWGSVMHAVDENGKLRYHKDGTPVMVPNPKRMGETFRRWKRELEKLGYKVEHRELKAHEYGAPTIRKRLFIIARCDGRPIVWPEQTHGPGKLPYRTAAECIDFSVPAGSIFERKRPLVEGTLRRIAKGLKRYVLEAKEPFIVRTGHWSNITGEGFGFRGQGVNKPLATVCATNDKALVVPYIATCNHQGEGFRGFGVNEPAKTLCAARDAHGLVMPYIVGAGGAARTGEPQTVDAPVTTLPTQRGRRLTAPFLAGVGGRAGQSRPRALNEPTATVTAKADQGMAVPVMVRLDAPEMAPLPAAEHGHAVAAPHLLKFRHYSHGASLQAPLHTISAEGQHHGMVVPYLVGAGGPSYGGKPRGVDGPMHTLLAENHQCMVAPHLVGIDHRSSGDSAAWDAKNPLTTITAENRHAVVASFIVKQNGGHESPGWPLDKPLSTITTKDHHWPAMVKLTPEQSGAYDRADHADDVSKFLREFLGEEHADGIVHLPDGDYRIVDLGLRMLKPRELFSAQGFTREYIIDPTFNGKPLTATAQVRMCGNSVSPVMSRAIISANFHGYDEEVENAA